LFSYCSDNLFASRPVVIVLESFSTILFDFLKAVFTLIT